MTGPIPAELGRLVNLEDLELAFNMKLSGPLPLPLGAPLNGVDLHFTRVCVPPADAAFEGLGGHGQFSFVRADVRGCQGSRCPR